MKLFLLTKLSIVEREAGDLHARVHCEDVITALAAKHSCVAPASSQEQQHHEHHTGEGSYCADISARLHCTTHHT